MNKTIILLIPFIFATAFIKAQPAMQFTGLDCNGNSVDLFADLDAGKAVVLFFYMPSCGACPPPAQKIQTMANDINAEHPDFVKGYAFPFNNTTDCAASLDWASTSSVDHFFTAMDSGATMVAYYGGFGMPTVVLVGGLDHRIIFTTLSFITSDTAVMGDSIRALYSQLNGISHLPESVSSFDVFPNPASDFITIKLEIQESANLMLDITDLQGKLVARIMNEKQNGTVAREFRTAGLSEGIYLVRLQVDGKTVTRKVTITH